jgi:hypothetical protein
VGSESNIGEVLEQVPCSLPAVGERSLDGTRTGPTHTSSTMDESSSTLEEINDRHIVRPMFDSAISDATDPKLVTL